MTKQISSTRNHEGLLKNGIIMSQYSKYCRFELILNTATYAAPVTILPLMASKFSLLMK